MRSMVEGALAEGRSQPYHSNRRSAASNPNTAFFAAIRGGGASATVGASRVSHPGARSAKAISPSVVNGSPPPLRPNSVGPTPLTQ